jgi:Condensation domain
MSTVEERDTAKDTVTFDFRGTRSTTEILTWGQRAIWTAIDRTRPADSYFNFARTLPVPDRLDGRPVGVDDVLGALATVFGRYEALRTRTPVVDGEPRQVVSATGTVTVEVIRAADGDAADTATRTADGYCATAFDYAADWPLRIGIVTVDGVPSFVALAFCHLASDLGGSAFVLRDIAAVVAGTDLVDAAETQPVDLARQQRSAEGQRAASAAARYWRRAYERIPASMFEREVDVPEQPRYQRVLLVSPALGAAAAMLGDRFGTGSSAVLNAATAATIGALTGHDTCAVLAITKNRFRSQMRDMVSTLSLEGLIVVPLEGLSDFESAVRATWRASVPAYRYAHYDERDRDRVVREVSDSRGEHVHPYCCLNDLRDDTDAPPVDDTPLPELLTRSSVWWLPPLEKLSCRFCLHIVDAPGGLALRVTADTAFMPKRHMLAFLRSVEDLVVSSVDGSVPLADLSERVERSAV